MILKLYNLNGDKNKAYDVVQLTRARPYLTQSTCTFPFPTFTLQHAIHLLLQICRQKGNKSTAFLRRAHVQVCTSFNLGCGSGSVFS